MIYKFLLVLSCIYIVFGLIGIFRFSHVYERLLVSSKIDTAATLTILIALILKSGFSGYSMKLVIILIFLMITGPVTTHVIARSAYRNGIDIEKEGKE
jgi:multicomponent Na+:H+ antiporter subunit G